VKVSKLNYSQTTISWHHSEAAVEVVAREDLPGVVLEAHSAADLEEAFEEDPGVALVAAPEVVEVLREGVTSSHEAAFGRDLATGSSTASVSRKPTPSLAKRTFRKW
jgi:hypothetical protein